MRSLWSAAFPSAADRPPPQPPYVLPFNDPGGPPAVSGTAAGAPTAVSTALIIVGFLARRLGALPRFVHERDDRTRRPVTDPRFGFLTGAPNRDQHSVPFWTSAFAHLEGWADMFLWRRTVGADTVGLDLVHPGAVKVVRDPATGERTYRLHGADTAHGSDEVVHVVGGVSWDGLRGVPPVRAGLGAHETARLQDRWQRDFLRSGSAPAGVMSTPAELDDQAVAEFYSAWEATHGGRMGGVVLVEGGAQFTPVTIPPAEAQLLQARQFSREEVLGFYAPGMPHHLIGWKSNTSNWGTGIEQQGIHLVQHVLLLRLDLVSDVLSRALLPPGLRLGFDVGMWLRGDTKTQAQTFAAMRAGGAITRDEWRAEAGLPVLGAPDDVWQPRNMDAIAVG